MNNAGIIKRTPMLEMETADFRQVIDIDLTAPFIVSKAVLPGMLRKGHGKIINVCSMLSEVGRETVAAYTAAKGGLKMLTKNIASEFGGRNISATALGPATSRRRRRRRCARRAILQCVHLVKNTGAPLGYAGRSHGPCRVPGIGRL